MKKSISSPKVTKVPDSICHRLHGYTLAASAAGVAMLALASRGAAEIVYTKTNTAASSLDLTGYGGTDFSFSAGRATCSGDRCSVRLWVGADQPGNAVEMGPLGGGVVIGPAIEGWGSGGVMLYGIYSTYQFRGFTICSGWWAKTHNRYLGLKFMISGQVHYGWARLSGSCPSWDDPELQLTGYAYETIPNKGIKAGQQVEGKFDESVNTTDEPTPTAVPVPTSPSLGMLANGAQALRQWRAPQNNFVGSNK